MRKADRNMTGGPEPIPDFCKLGRIKGPRRSNAFTKLRAEAYSFGLTLERASKGYRLEGGDLPVSGEWYRTLDDVKEEMINYGWEESE